MILNKNILKQAIMESLDEARSWEQSDTITVNGVKMSMKDYKKMLKAKKDAAAQQNGTAPVKKAASPSRRTIERNSLQAQIREIMKSSKVISNLQNFYNNAEGVFGKQNTNFIMGVGNIQRQFTLFNIEARKFFAALDAVKNSKGVKILRDNATELSYRMEDTFIRALELYAEVEKSGVLDRFANMPIIAGYQKVIGLKELIRRIFNAKNKVRKAVNDLVVLAGGDPREMSSIAQDPVKKSNSTPTSPFKSATNNPPKTKSPFKTALPKQSQEKTTHDNFWDKVRAAWKEFEESGKEHPWLEESIRESIKKIIKEDMLNEVQTKIDNFQKRADFIDKWNQTNGQNPDNVWFIQIMIRKKDNQNLDLKSMYPGSYHAGAVYGNFSNGGAFLVHDGAELMSIKQQVIDYCDKNNARAVIWLNPRNEKAVQAYLPKYRATRLVDKHGKPLPVTDARYINALELLYGQCKFDRKNFPDRKYCKYDVDSTDPKEQSFVIHTIQAHLNLPDDCFEKTPSGGLHIICPNQYDPIMKKLSYDLRYLDKGKTDIRTHKVSDHPDLGCYQTAHFNEDANVLLYANVDTPSY